MKNAAKLTKKSQYGQGMTEYIIIVAMVAIAAIAVYQLFGKTVRGQTAAIAMELAGEDGMEGTKVAQDAAKTSVEKANAAIGLNNFSSENNAN